MTQRRNKLKLSQVGVYKLQRIFKGGTLTLCGQGNFDRRMIEITRGVVIQPFIIEVFLHNASEKTDFNVSHVYTTNMCSLSYTARTLLKNKVNPTGVI